MPLIQDLPVVMMSSVGNGFSALIIILFILIIGVWYYGHRVVAQLTSAEKRDA